MLMQHVSLHDTIDTTSHTPAHTRLLEHTSPYNNTAVDAALRGVHEMLSVGWVPHQPSHALDDVSTPGFDRALGIVIPSHIVESV